MAKKLFSVLCAVALFFCALIQPAAASTARPEAILLFGDSISTGYGLSNVTQSFGKQLENTLGISADDYRNFAVNGATSAQILTIVKSHPKDISAADTVLLTAGGNDMLSIFLASAKTALGLPASATTAQFAVAALTKDNASSLIAAQLQTQSTQAKLIAAQTVFSKNLSDIVAAVRAANPSAKLYIQTIYNPFSGISGMEGLSKSADTILGAMNKSITNGAAGGSSGSGYTVIDTETAFRGKADRLTNMAVFDIHPNSDGHKVIFNLAYTAITGKPYTPPTIACILQNGRLTVNVTGLPVGAAQLSVTAVNADDPKNRQEKTAAVSGGKASMEIAVKGTSYTVTLSELAADQEIFLLSTVLVKDKSSSVSIRYAVHMQTKSWSAFAKDGAQAGTTGNAQCIQAIEATVTGKLPFGAAVLYQTYLQGKGWQPTAKNGAASALDGKNMAVKAIRFTLSGLPGYSVKYRAFTKGKYWNSWVRTKNGVSVTKAAVTGSTAQSAGIQAIEIQLVKQ